MTPNRQTQKKKASHLNRTKPPKTTKKKKIPQTTKNKKDYKKKDYKKKRNRTTGRRDFRNRGSRGGGLHRGDEALILQLRRLQGRALRGDLRGELPLSRSVGGRRSAVGSPGSRARIAKKRRKKQGVFLFSPFFCGAVPPRNPKSRDCGKWLFLLAPKVLLLIASMAVVETEEALLQ